MKHFKIQLTLGSETKKSYTWIIINSRPQKQDVKDVLDRFVDQAFKEFK